MLCQKLTTLQPRSFLYSNVKLYKWYVYIWHKQILPYISEIIIYYVVKTYTVIDMINNLYWYLLIQSCKYKYIENYAIFIVYPYA